MKFRHLLIGLSLTYFLRISYLIANPIEINREIESDCFEKDCIVFEGDWIRLGEGEYTHEVFTDDLSLNPEIPYSEYTGSLTSIGNIYYLHEAYSEVKLFFAVRQSDQVSFLSAPWFILYSLTNYLPVYRHVETVP